MKGIDRLVDYLFYDDIRGIELFSALNLFSWALVLEQNPGLLSRDSYSLLLSVGHKAPALVFLAVACSQLIATVWHKKPPLRFYSMALAAGCWAMISVQFWLSGTLTTANLNYSLLMLACAASGVRLGWKM